MEAFQGLHDPCWREGARSVYRNAAIAQGVCHGIRYGGMRTNGSALADAAHAKRIETRGCFHMPKFEFRRTIVRSGQNVIHQRPRLQMSARIVYHLFAARPRQFPELLRRLFGLRPRGGSRSFRNRAPRCSEEFSTVQFPDRFQPLPHVLHRSNKVLEFEDDDWLRFSVAHVPPAAMPDEREFSYSAINSSTGFDILTPPSQRKDAGLHSRAAAKQQRIYPTSLVRSFIPWRPPASSSGAPRLANVRRQTGTSSVSPKAGWRLRSIEMPPRSPRPPVAAAWFPSLGQPA